MSTIQQGRALAAASRRAEVSSLLRHQRRCRHAEQLERDLAREGALHLKDAADACGELEDRRSKEKELKEKFERKRIMGERVPPSRQERCFSEMEKTEKEHEEVEREIQQAKSQVRLRFISAAPQGAEAGEPATRNKRGRWVEGSGGITGCRH